MTNQPRRNSLRGMASELGCSHSSLSEAIHARRLTAGVRFDAHGRIAIVDADALARQWREVHVPRIDGPWRPVSENPDCVTVSTSEGSFTARNLTGADMRRHLAEWGDPLFNVLTRQDLLELIPDKRLHRALLLKWAAAEGVGLVDDDTPDAGEVEP